MLALAVPTRYEAGGRPPCDQTALQTDVRGREVPQLKYAA